MNLIQHFVNGKTYKGSSSKKGKVYNPATGDQESEVILGNKEDLNKTVEIAKKAYESWSLKPPLQRARVMFKFKELIEKNSDDIIKLIVSEHGKVYEDARGSLTRGLEVVEFACGIPQILKGEFTENVGSEVDSWSIRQPLGVCAGITPFNFPAMVPMWMFPMAIACGNSFILKPSEKDPSCAFRLAELLNEAGLPEGVFNVINGDKEVVDAILNNNDIQAVSFVGSTPVAKYIYENAAKNEKRVQALGGAKNHCVVMPDCDLDQAVNGLMGAAYGSAGERCMAQSVAVAVGDIADELVEKIHIEAQKLKVAPWTDKDSDMGPVISKEHKDKIERVIASSSVESIISLISVIRDNLGGEAFGISLRLKALGFLSQKNKVHQKVIGYGKRSFENLKNISDRYFSDFDQNDKEKFVKFWNSDRINKNPLLRFFSHLKSGATDESISPRKFSELLGVDLSIADEMIRKWRFELHQALKEAENE